MKTPPGYEEFHQVYLDARDRSSKGKGMQRHGDGKPFLDQDIVQEGLWMPKPYHQLCQIRKKAKESVRMSPEDAYQEILDVIVYAIGAALCYDRKIVAKAIEDGFDLPNPTTLGELKQINLWPVWNPGGHRDDDD